MKNIKTIISIFLLLILFTGIISGIGITCHADEPATEYDNVEDYLNIKYSKSNKNGFKSALGYACFSMKRLVYVGIAEKAINVIKKADTWLDDASGPLDGVINAIAAIGAAMMFVYIIMDFIDQVRLTGESTVELYVKTAIKLVGAAFICGNYSSIGEDMIKFGSGLVQKVGEASASTGHIAELQTMLDECRGYGTLMGLSEMAMALIPWLAAYICIIIIYYLVFARIFELAIRWAFLPIGTAEMFAGNSVVHSGGFRYIKKLIAVGMQSGVMMAVLMIMGALASHIEGNVDILGIDTFPQVLLSITTAGVLIKSSSLANDMMGV